MAKLIKYLQKLWFDDFDEEAKSYGNGKKGGSTKTKFGLKGDRALSSKSQRVYILIHKQNFFCSKITVCVLFNTFCIKNKYIFKIESYFLNLNSVQANCMPKKYKLAQY
jgi:hypothetical protein